MPVVRTNVGRRPAAVAAPEQTEPFQVDDDVAGTIKKEDDGPEFDLEAEDETWADVLALARRPLDVAD